LRLYSLYSDDDGVALFTTRRGVESARRKWLKAGANGVSEIGEHEIDEPGPKTTIALKTAGTGDYGTGALFDRMREMRRKYMMELDFQKIPRVNRKFARDTAGVLGYMAACPYHQLGITKAWTSWEYFKFVIEPLYMAGGMGTRLCAEWRVKCSRAGCSDPRVKAFIADAQKMTDLRGKECK
jgi:hypothetical protein